METFQPHITIINNKEFELVQDFTCTFRLEGTTYRITIPKDRISDGESSPAFSWGFGFKPISLTLAASAVHDELYARRGVLRINQLKELYDGVWIGSHRIFTRKESDLIYRFLSKSRNVGRLRVALEYRALRAFGWGPW